MTDLIAGRQPVLEALKSGREIEKIVILYGTRGEVIDRIRHNANRRSIPVVEADHERFQRLATTENAQGVLALVGSSTSLDVEDLLKAAREKNEPPFLLLIDGVEDPQNLGALIRTAECAGAHGVVLPKHHSASITQTVAKASAGASMHLPSARVPNLVHVMTELKKAGLWIIGADAKGDRSYTEVDYKGPVAIVVGSEGKGMRRLVREQCDFVVKIPLYGVIESLNVSVAGGLVMFEAARRRHGTGAKQSD